jgi:sugar lactone lactonase YvrE
MNNNVRSWSDNRGNSPLASLAKPLGVLLVLAWGAVAPLEAQTVTTLISSNLFEPHDVATDGTNAYLTDASNNRIVKFSLSTSNLTTLAGDSGPAGAGYANGSGAGALFNQPLGIVYARGGLVVVDSGNQVIRFVTTNGVASLLAGTPTNVVNGVGGYNTNGLGGFVNGIGTDAQFAFPTAITADAVGNLYVADTGNNAIRVIDTTAAANVTTIQVTNTTFNAPEAVALDTNGNLWVADTGNNRICVISNITVTANQKAYVIANITGVNGSKDDVYATNATFNFPSGLLWSTNMNSLLISDTGNDTIRSLYQTNAQGQSAVWWVQTIAGSAGQAGQVDGAPLLATFDAPVGLALDLRDGNNFYYVVDRSSASNGTLRAVQPSVLPQLIPGPPAIAITNPANNAVFITPASLTIALTTSDTNLLGSITNIEVLTNNVIWSSNSTALSYAFKPAAGTYVLLAIATDNYGISATSAPVNITVISPLAPVIGIVLPTNASFFTEPAYITITETNLDPNTAYDPSASITNVTIYANGTNIPTVPQSSNIFKWNNPGVGQYSLTAVARESLGLSATSAPVNVTVLGVYDPIVSIISPPGGTVFFAPTNITVTVNAVDPNTNGVSNDSIGQISGGVSLYSGTTFVGLANLSTPPSTYTFVWNNPAIGNYTLTAVATDTLFQVSGTSAPVNIIVTLPPPPAPVISPNSGYFPFCETIQITETAPNQPTNLSLYYTTDGSTPTTNSTPVSPLSYNNGVYTGSILWCNPSNDLSHLQIIAFNGVVTSTNVAAGQASSTNIVGFVRGATNGAGATVILPIVVDLTSNGVLDSLQFRAEVVNTNGMSNAITSLTLLPLSSNEFVPLIGPGADNTPVTFETVSYLLTNSSGVITQGLLISAAGGSSGFAVTGFGVVGLVALQIPTNVAAGQTYQLDVVNPSGTSDAQQDQVGMVANSTQTLMVKSIDYFEGDSSPGSGYNAGEFGNGILNAADVNNALYASVGIRVPYPFSDVYNAMDTYPETATELGDGFITYLDWQTTLYRSLGLQTNNWVRFWSNGVRDHLAITWSPGQIVPIGVTPQVVSAQTFAGNHAGPKDISSLPGLVWFREAAITAGTLANVGAGNICSLPVYAKVQPGYNLSGLQFRATLVANGDAPQPGAIEFIPAAGVPANTQLPGLAPYDIVCAWDLGAFEIPLEGDTLLGSVNFQVPGSAQAGQSYSLHFSGVDGAPDLETLYQLESVPGAAWVLSAALQPAQITSDEWRTNFFGNYANPLAADNADPDGDGSLNWQEYVAGTNPTNALSRLQFSGITLATNKPGPATLSWLTAPGKTYFLQSMPALGGTEWSVISTTVGDGNIYEFTPTPGGKTSFYRICVQP